MNNQQYNNCIVLIGTSGTGKSSWCTNYLKENPNFLRINRDSIRLTLVGDLTGYYQRKDLNSIEKIVSQTEVNIFNSLSNSNKEIIIDNCNLKESYINLWIKECNIFRYDIKFKFFDCDLLVAKDRVLVRDYGLLNPEDCTDKQWDSLNYIDKQFESYLQIKKYIQTNYKNQII